MALERRAPCSLFAGGLYCVLISVRHIAVQKRAHLRNNLMGRMDALTVMATWEQQSDEHALDLGVVYAVM